MAAFILSGCGSISETPDPKPSAEETVSDEEGSDRYRVDYLGKKNLFENAERSYEAGVEVTLYYDQIADGMDYVFFLDDEQLDAELSEDKGYIVSFTMPDHDVVLKVGEREISATETISLRDRLISSSGYEDSEIISFFSDDYDGDGSEEAFALIGEASDGVAGEIIVDGEIWFVTGSTCRMLCHSVGMGIQSDAHYMTVGDTEYILFDDEFMSESYTRAYYVKDSEAYEFELSGIGSIWGDENEPDRFTITDSTYDGMYDAEMGFMVGHTWKKYYFYYDSEAGQIYEYGGTAIDAATAEYLCGRDLIADLVPEGDTVDSVFIRGNGLLVINYEHADEDGSIEYFHYIYDTLGNSFVDDFGMAIDYEEPQSGTCLSALVPEIASYPEIQGPDGNVWFGN